MRKLPRGMGWVLLIGGGAAVWLWWRNRPQAQAGSSAYGTQAGSSAFGPRTVNIRQGPQLTLANFWRPPKKK